MAKRVMQFRFYSEHDDRNYPGSCDLQSLQSGSIFNSDNREKYVPIVQLGIQSLPGTKFYLNNSLKDPIIIGSTGIYELDIDGMAEITHLQFDRESLNTISENANVSLIIDIIYDDKKEAR